MEMRAADDVGIGEDLTPPVGPLAAALRDVHLDSHCSFCFRPLDVPRNADPFFLVCGTDCPVRYCSRDCRDSDLATHLSSGECRLLRLLRSDPALSSDDDLADLRLALRLLYSLEKLGYSFREARVAGLMTNRDKIENSEGGRLMSLARDSRGEAESLKEEAALCAVLTNAVEVLVKDGFAVGVAVYGPGFSWFNHSCAPNSCYRFELASPGKDFPENVPVPRVLAFGEESTEKRHSELWSKYQFVCCCPRCYASSQNFVDSILQVCMVESPTSLNLQSGNLLEHPSGQANICSTSNSFSYDGASWWVLNDSLEQAVESYMCDGDAEACCERLETFLSQGFNYEVGKERNPSYRLHHSDNRFSNSLVADIAMRHSKPEFPCTFSHPDLNSRFSCVSTDNSRDDILKAEPAEGDQHKYKCVCHLMSKNHSATNLHPLNYVSLKAFVTLASAYRVRAEGKLAFSRDKTSLSEATELSKTAAAYSLLLASGVHYLFLSETSLIASAAQLWVSAGETLLRFLGCLKQGSDGIDFRPLSCSHSIHYNIKANACFLDEFEGTCKGFYDCIKKSSLCLWPFLIEGLPHLSFINDSLDFSWIKRRDRCQERTCWVKESIWQHLYELVAHCLFYGGFLAGVCYGFQSHLAGNARELLLYVQTIVEYDGFKSKIVQSKRPTTALSGSSTAPQERKVQQRLGKEREAMQ